MRLWVAADLTTSEIIEKKPGKCIDLFFGKLTALKKALFHDHEAEFHSKWK
jgi:hypothetical protein